MELSAHVGLAVVVSAATALLVEVTLLPIAPTAVVATMVVYMGGYGLLVPVLTARALAPFASGAGAAAAVLGFAEMALAGTGSALAGVFPASFKAMAGLVLACALLSLVASWPGRSLQPSGKFARP